MDDELEPHAARRTVANIPNQIFFCIEFSREERLAHRVAHPRDHADIPEATVTGGAALRCRTWAASSVLAGS
jgi:hypothetical protein